MKHYSEYQTRYTWRDVALAARLLFLDFLTLDSGNRFSSDDYAGYMLSAISIVDGTFDEQAKLNYFLHPTQLPLEASAEEGLVYTWGYPLLLAPIYSLVGFDRTDYHSMVYYTLPTAVAFACTGALLYLFFRRRFGTAVSLGLSLLCCLSHRFFALAGHIQTDMVFMALSVLLYWLTEVYLSRPDWRIPLGCLLGAAMWFAYEVRLNGFTLCLLMALAHLIFVLREWRLGEQKTPFWQHFLPYGVFAVLALVSEQLIFRPATSNMSDFTRITQEQLVKNIGTYWKMIREWLESFWFHGPLEGLGGLPMVYLMLVLLVAGVICHGLKHNLHLTLLLLGTFGILLFLPFTQDFRYFMNVMPLILLFAGYGLKELYSFVARKLKPPVQRALAVCFCAAVLVMGGLAVADTGAAALEEYRHRGDPKPTTDAYTDDAIAMYHYIQQNTAEDCVIAFLKPRCLYLNTLRLSFNPAVNDHSIDNADYFLVFNKRGQGSLMEGKAYFEAVYGNDLLTLYANRQRVIQ